MAETGLFRWYNPARYYVAGDQKSGRVQCDVKAGAYQGYVYSFSLFKEGQYLCIGKFHRAIESHLREKAMSIRIAFAYSIREVVVIIGKYT